MPTIKKMSEKLRNPIHSRIGRRVILIMLLLSSVFSLTITLIQVAWDYNSQLEQVELRHKEIEEIHVPLIAASLWEFDLTLLQQKLDGLAELPRIDFLKVRSSGDEFSAGTPIGEDAIINEYWIAYQSNNNVEPELLGVLRVESDKQQIYDLLLKDAVVTLSITALETAVLCLVILFIIHESINKRIFSVAQYLHRYDPQRPSSPLSLNVNQFMAQSGDEIYQLGDATNKITTRLTLLYNHIKYEQERFSDFANVASDWLWESDSDGVLIYISEQMREHLAISDKQQLRFRDLPILANARRLLAHIEQKRDFSFCQESIEINGEVQNLLFHGIANYSEGQFVGFRGTAIDITVLQQAQVALEELNNNLEQKVIERTKDLETSMINLKRAQQQLIESEKLAALGGLVSGVAHEVNTPLGISVTAASVIKEVVVELNTAFEKQTLTTTQFTQLMQRMNSSITMLESNLSRGAKLIKDFKQTAVDQVSESLSRFCIHQVLDALIASLHPETNKIPVTPIIHGSETILMTSLPGVLTQIFTNLILNSVNHAFDEQTSPEIHILFEEQGENICFEYKDNGSGISKELHEKIFEPFYTSKRGKGGSGLGLNLVFNLVHQKLGGKLEFDSTPGEGVHFTFYIPKTLS